MASGVKKPNFGHPLSTIGKVVGVFLLSQLIAGIIVEFILAAMHPANYSIDESAASQFFYLLLAEGLAVLAVRQLLKRQKLGWSSIGFGRKPKRGDIYKAVIGFAAFYAILIVVSLILSAIFPGLNNGQQDVGFTHLTTPLDSILAFVALVFLPPLGEETLIRGYLYSGLRSRLNFRYALLLTSLLFGAAHLQFGSGSPLLWAAGVDTFILSVVLVYLRESTGALYAGILVHMLNNLIAFGVKFH